MLGLYSICNIECCKKMAEIIHIINRGVDKRKIFLDDQDHFRFIHNLYAFNDRNNASGNRYSFAQSNNIEDCKFRQNKQEDQRELLVDIHAFVAMPNHYHILASPRSEDSIPRFMHKIDMGYSKYFNLKYQRTGTLFEGRYKPILVKKEAHFMHLPYYIHCNPLDLITPGWRRRKIKDSLSALRFLESYRWSSHLDYLGQTNFPSVIDTTLFLGFFGGTAGYKNDIEQWLKDMDLGNLNAASLEK